MGTKIQRLTRVFVKENLTFAKNCGHLGDTVRTLLK